MRSGRQRGFSEFPITIDRTSETLLPDQIVHAIRDGINQNAIRAGEPVPPTRELASALGVARGVVVSAYSQLIEEGYLSAGHGRGTQVNPDLKLPASTNDTAVSRLATSGEPEQNEQSRNVRTPGPLSPGLPDTGALNTAAWRAAWRNAVTKAHLESPPLGDPRLREAIAEHLRRMRGTNRPGTDIVVTAGAREGLGLLLNALSSAKGQALTIGVEDPGYPSLRRVASQLGARVVAMPVDAEGLITDDLLSSPIDAVIVTPSHQYPLGGSLPLARRHELLAWARAANTVIIEDDFDSELRHSGSPLPTLASLDDPHEGSVVLLGTFSKTVSQALSAGFLLAPTRLLQLIEPVRRVLGGPVSAVVQTALSEYLESGELRKHTARMRRKYAARRELVVERLFGSPGATVRPMSGGLHAVIELEGAARAEAEALSRSTGLGAVPLSSYWHGEDHKLERYGLVIGAGGNAPDREFEAALGQLREVLHEVSRVIRAD